MRYILALTAFLIAAPALAQSTGDAALDARIGALLDGCKNAPVETRVHTCYANSKFAAELYTQGIAAKKLREKGK